MFVNSPLSSRGFCSVAVGREGTWRKQKLRLPREVNWKRSHMGDGKHHHGEDGPGHVHDTSLLTSKDTSNPGVRITRIGLLVNLGLVVVKAVAGVVLHSSSLLADAGHSAADILSDILTLATLTFSLKTPNSRYPLGYGKVETLGAIGVSSLLCISLSLRELIGIVLGGIGIGLSSLDALLATLPPHTIPEFVEQLLSFGHGHSHGPAIGADPMALWVAGGSIGIKEWLFRRSIFSPVQDSVC